MGDDDYGTGDGEDSPDIENEFLIYAAPWRQVDLLVVVDDGWTMAGEHATLVGNIERFIKVLEDPEIAANYRIGVVSAGLDHPACAAASPDAATMSIESCRTRLDDFLASDGAGQSLDETSAGCTDVCAHDMVQTTPLAPDTTARPWIEYTSGEYNSSPLNAVEALSCSLPKGISGCAFSSPLEAMRQALEASKDPASPMFGFMRSQAHLAVLILTDKDDCSINPDHASALAPGGVLWRENGMGFPALSMCWDAGVACTGGGPIYDECNTQHVDSTGNQTDDPDAAVIYPVERYIDYLNVIEAEKVDHGSEGTEVVVSVVTGVPEGFASGDVDLIYAPPKDDPMGFGIAPGCEGASALAFPPTRLREFGLAFEIGGDRNVSSICNEDFGPALQPLAESTKIGLRPICFPGCAADVDPKTPGTQQHCSIVRETEETTDIVPECVRGDNGEYVWLPEDRYQIPEGADTCVAFRVDHTGLTEAPQDDLSSECIEGHYNLEVAFEHLLLGGVPGARYFATCDLSPAPAIDCPSP